MSEHNYIMNYKVQGEKHNPHLIILHGLFGSMTNWTNVAKKLEPYFYVHRLDLRNHGNSFWAETMSYTDLANDLEHYLIHHDIKNYYLMGHSLGGKVSMHFLQTRSNLPKKTIIVDIAPIDYNESNTKIAKTLKDVDLKANSTRQQVNDSLSYTINDQSLRLFLLQNLVYENKKLKWRVNLPVIIKETPHIISFPSAPASNSEVLFIAGGDSSYIQQSAKKYIFSLFPNASISTINNAKHTPHVEQPEMFIDNVLDFLKIDNS